VDCPIPAQHRSRFSHDGKLVAYASDRGGAGSLAIWLRPFPSGEATRLTAESFNDSDPDFSPDDTRIVYRSERDGGGVYIAARSGTGAPRRLVAGGLRPRFSPDGKWIACYDGTVPGIESSSSPQRRGAEADTVRFSRFPFPCLVA